MVEQISTGALIAVLICSINAIVLILVIFIYVHNRRRRLNARLNEPEPFNGGPARRDNESDYDMTDGNKTDINDNDNSTWRSTSFRSNGSTITSAIPSPALDKPVVVKDVYYRQSFPVQRQESLDTPHHRLDPNHQPLVDPKVGIIIKDNLQQMSYHDPDGPAADDDLRNYIYEGGGGSTVTSLSSLGSGMSMDSDLDFDYLSKLGPRFATLYNIYSETSDS